MTKKIDVKKFKDVVAQLKSAQKQLQGLVNKETISDAKKYAEKSGTELKKLLDRDVKKVRAFVEKEANELKKFQKQIPGELAKFSKFIDGQKKELEKILKSVNAAQTAEKIQVKVGLKKKPKKAVKKSQPEVSQNAAQAESQQQ